MTSYWSIIWETSNTESLRGDPRSLNGKMPHEEALGSNGFQPWLRILEELKKNSLVSSSAPEPPNQNFWAWRTDGVFFKASGMIPRAWDCCLLRNEWLFCKSREGLRFICYSSYITLTGTTGKSSWKLLSDSFRSEGHGYISGAWSGLDPWGNSKMNPYLHFLNSSGRCCREGWGRTLS